MTAEQAAQETRVLRGSGRWLLELGSGFLQVLLELLNLCLGLLEGDVLHQHGLGEDVLRVRRCGQVLFRNCSASSSFSGSWVCLILLTRSFNIVLSCGVIAYSLYCLETRI